jgi:hypothetical protein
MSKKDKAQEQQQATVPVDSSAVTLADVLKDMEGVTVSDDKRLRVTAADKETLKARVTTVQSALADGYDVTVSPTYGDAAALGCVWNDLVATPKK